MIGVRGLGGVGRLESWRGWGRGVEVGSEGFKFGSEGMELGLKDFKPGGWGRGGQRSWGVGVEVAWVELKSRRSVGSGSWGQGLGSGLGKLGLRGMGGWGLRLVGLGRLGSGWGRG